MAKERGFKARIVEARSGVAPVGIRRAKRRKRGTSADIVVCRVGWIR